MVSCRLHGAVFLKRDVLLKLLEIMTCDSDFQELVFRKNIKALAGPSPLTSKNYLALYRVKYQRRHVGLHSRERVKEGRFGDRIN